MSKPTFFNISLILAFFLTGCAGSPKSLGKFFKDNNYNLIYPLDAKPAPGAIYKETKDKGLGQPLAYKETCAGELSTVPGNISFGTRSATSAVGINFLLGLSQSLAPVKTDLEGAFKKEVSYTVTSDVLETSECDWVTLKGYVREKMPPGDCKEALKQDGAVVLSKVAATQKFTFKFKGLKSGGIGVILQSLMGANLKAEKKDEETIVLEFEKPMKLCYQRWTPEELGMGRTGEPTDKGMHMISPPLLSSDTVKTLAFTEASLNAFTKAFFAIQ